MHMVRSTQQRVHWNELRYLLLCGAYVEGWVLTLPSAVCASTRKPSHKASMWLQLTQQLLVTSNFRQSLGFLVNLRKLGVFVARNNAGDQLSSSKGCISVSLSHFFQADQGKYFLR